MACDRAFPVWEWNCAGLDALVKRRHTEIATCMSSHAVTQSMRSHHWVVVERAIALAKVDDKLEQNEFDEPILEQRLHNCSF